MQPVRSIEDVYPAIDGLIAELRAAGHTNLATILHHRMHVVAWTTGTELYEELLTVLSRACSTGDTSLPEPLVEQAKRIAGVIENYLASR